LRQNAARSHKFGCSITTNQAAIIALFRVIGNLPPMPGVFPDYPAPVVRNTDTGRELVMMRWGMPPPPRAGGYPVTNIRNTSSPHWRAWLKSENRCLVPFNSFAEYAPEPNPETKKKDVVWFALNDDRPLAAFGGIWTEFRGDRGTKSKPIPGPHLVYGFLTTAPNAVVEPIHPKAMPVIGGVWAGSSILWKTERSPEDAAMYDACLAGKDGNTVACEAYVRVFDRVRAKDAALEKVLNEGGAKMLASGASKRDVVNWARGMGGVGSQISDAAGITLRELQSDKY
jgi:putative SOS response-associated peptidase YedK